jgi:hypothetical protein
MLGSSRGASRAAALVVATLALLPGPRARADDPAPPTSEAARRFDEGTRAFEAGDFLAAARLFLEAYAAERHHASLWNAARAYRRAGEHAAAANLYRRYLRETADTAPDRDAAIAELRALEPRLGRIVLVAPGVDAIAIDGVAVADREVWVDPGSHVVTGTVGGAPLSQTATVAAGESLSVALVPPAAPVAPPPPVSPLPSPAVGRDAPPAEPDGWPAWAVAPFAGATALGAALTIASGVDTLALRSDFDASGGTDAYAFYNGQFTQDRTNVFLAVTAGLGVITTCVALFAIDWNGAAAGGKVVGAASPGALVAVGRF